MEIQSVNSSSSARGSSGTSGSSNAKLEAATSSLKSSLDLQKLVLKLLESTGINVDTKA